MQAKLERRDHLHGRASGRVDDEHPLADELVHEPVVANREVVDRTFAAAQRRDRRHGVIDVPAWRCSLGPAREPFLQRVEEASGRPRRLHLDDLQLGLRLLLARVENGAFGPQLGEEHPRVIDS